MRSERLLKDESDGDGGQDRCEKLEEGNGPTVEAHRKGALHEPDCREGGAAGPRRACSKREPGEAEAERESHEICVRDREGGRSLETRRQIKAERGDRNRSEGRDDGRRHPRRQFLPEPAVESPAHDPFEEEGAQNGGRSEPDEAAHVHVLRER
jgi:hypothetical protein